MLSDDVCSHEPSEGLTLTCDLVALSPLEKHLRTNLNLVTTSHFRISS